MTGNKKGTCTCTCIPCPNCKHLSFEEQKNCQVCGGGMEVNGPGPGKIRNRRCPVHEVDYPIYPIQPAI